MNLSWGQILAILVFCGGVIAAGVPFFNFLAARVDARKKEKAERAAKEKADSAEIRKEEREDYRESLEFYKARCAECEKELAELETTSPDSRKRKRQMQALVLKMSRNIFEMEKAFQEKYSIAELLGIFMSIKKIFNELEDLMP